MNDARKIILPDMTTMDEDALAYRENHHDLFGHYPPRNPQDKCEHEIHAAIRHRMSQPGVDVTMPFDTSDVVSEDSLENQIGKDRYDYVYGRTQQWQKSVEEQQREESLRKAGIIVPGRVY